MKIATSELKGRLLDWAVAKATNTEARVGTSGTLYAFSRGGLPVTYAPTTDNGIGGPILDQYDVSVWLTLNGLGDRGKWSACMPDWFDEDDQTKPLEPEAAYGDTRLEAGMRALVRDRLGLEVDVPDELIRTLPSPDEEGL